MSTPVRRAGITLIAAALLAMSCGGDDASTAVPDDGGSGADTSASVDGRADGDSATGRADAAGDERSPCPAGRLLCGSACVDPSTDKDNCGACGYECTIGAPSTVECALGRCVATLATITGQLGQAFIDASYVYAFNAISQSAVKVPIGGGAPVTVLTGMATGTLIAVDVASFYWFGSDSQIWFASLDGSAPRVLSTKVARPVGTIVGANALYFASGPQVDLLELRGGDPIVLATEAPGADIGGLVADATSFYFTDSTGNVSSVPRDGGKPTKLAFNQTSPTEIAVSATDVYWYAVDSSTSQAALWKVPIGGGAWTKLMTVARSIRVDGASLYGAQYQAGLVKIPLAGGPVTILSASTTAVPGAIDATSVYWTEYTNNGVGKVMKLWPK